MMRLLNLLPWRQSQRQQRVYRWVGLFGLVLVLVPLLATMVRLFLLPDIRQQQAQNGYLANVQSALQRLHQQRLVLQEQHKKWLALQQLRDVQQQAIQLWESRLIQLASVMPGGSWLSSLALHKRQFVVKGHVNLLQDVQRLEKELARLAGVARVQTGSVQQETRGGFGFVFTLTLAEGVDGRGH
ncbi:hypothetical protein EHN07_08270 [Buttiauxella warmboldiae]|uniref:Fimbrial assembly protein n=1 Tax=Buttiauxella warmboldiae TaxID=82993 RepID=A0A3N5E925_9ENTR|nr:hypothetical protein [Buttiauxella warmboldiae]RPH28733.1 hypothetical protein EHN07_08270 [Buttiauxella warmboldiae]